MIKKTMALVVVALVSVAVNVLHSDTSYAQSAPPPPTFHVAVALDELGNVIPGAAYEGWSCTSTSEPGWYCISLNDYAWFDPGLADTGVAFVEDLYIPYDSNYSVTSCSDPLMGMFIVLRQTSTAPGYTFSDGLNVFCLTTDGWVSDGTQIVNGPIQSSGSIPVPFSQAPTASLAPNVTASICYQIELCGLCKTREG